MLNILLYYGAHPKFIILHIIDLLRKRAIIYSKTHLKQNPPNEFYKLRISSPNIFMLKAINELKHLFNLERLRNINS